MAKAFPKSQFVGYDFHPNSIRDAAAHAKSHGVTANAQFAVGLAKDYPGKDFDLVTCFDCLHDMGDPAGAAAHIRQSLKSDGTWMIVEPVAGDTLQQNLNPVGRLYYAGSTMICLPTSRSQEVGAALGAQAGEKKLREVIHSGGFSSVRRATETPFNMILEADHSHVRPGGGSERRWSHQAATYGQHVVECRRSLPVLALFGPYRPG